MMIFQNLRCLEIEFFNDWVMILLSVHDVTSIFQSKGRW